MHKVLWVLQVVLGVVFVVSGVVHLVMPEGLPAQAEWMYDLPEGIHYIAGIAEVLGGLGLILPGLTKIRTELTPLAAAGLLVVMVGAGIWHIPRGETRNTVINLVLAVLLGFIAYGRWKKAPLTS